VTAPPRREFARPNERAIFSIFSVFCTLFLRLVQAASFFFLKLRE